MRDNRLITVMRDCSDSRAGFGNEDCKRKKKGKKNTE